MSEKINSRRRGFMGTTALAIAAAQSGVLGTAKAQAHLSKPTILAPVKPSAHTSFASLKQINAGLLNVGYAEAGPADGPAVILLHGWPYDIYSFVDVAPLLASRGYRVIVPYVAKYTRDFARLIWKNASPQWRFDEATFERSAAAFSNPDHVNITIHKYRWRQGLAAGEPRYNEFEQKLASAPPRRADHHDGGRRQWGSASAAQRLRSKVHGQIRAPTHHGRCRPQPSAGSATGVRAGCDRRRPVPVALTRTLAFRSSR